MKEILTDEELELMSYDDVAYAILKNNGQKMTIKDLFTKVLKIMKLAESEYEKHIGDFFELLSTDKRFIMLENGFWDLRVNHSHKIKIDNEDDDFLEDVEIDDTNKEDDAEDIIDIDADEDDDDAEDDLSELTVIDEDEEDIML